ncbi:MAG: glycosyltransferase family 4 protein [Chloroflexi bacterium]|nr:glycosyltransferase family 4 protein [Chloroflexota bacterium]
MTDRPDRPLRVLLATDFFHPHLGGAERQVRLLASALAARGHDVQVVTAAQPGLDGHELVDGVPVRRLPAAATLLPVLAGDPRRRFLPPLPDPLLAARLARLVRRSRPDVVHANGWIAYSCAAASGRPLVLSVRDYGYACATRTLLQDDRRLCSGPGPRKCLRCAGGHYGAVKGFVSVGGVFAGRSLLARRVGGVHSVSRFVEDALRRDLAHGPDWSGIRFERIPDVVASDDTRAMPVAERALVDRLPGRPFILFVGALQRHKGLFVILGAYERLRAEVPAESVPPLVLIGTRWPDTPQELPHGVTVLEDVPHRVVMEAWRRSSFGVAPSLWPDPLPGVVREAMACGRPVIGSRAGGIPDMIDDGVNGLLVEPGDVHGLAAAMHRLVTDPARATSMGTAGRLSVAALGPEQIAARFESFYRSVPGVVS